MSSNHGKGGGGQPADDRTLLDPLDADELRALREARQRLQAGRQQQAPANPVGPDADSEDIGDAPTRAMMAIPSFDRAGGEPAVQETSQPKFMAEPKPMRSGAVTKPDQVATVLDGTVPAGGVTSGQGGSPAPGGLPGQPPPKGTPDGFGENTLMWMQPVKAPEAEVIPERGRAAAGGVLPQAHPAQTKGRQAAQTLVVALGVVVVIIFAIVFLRPHAPPSVVKLITNPPGATVLIDGTTTSVKTPMKASLPPGSHEIEVRMAGHKTEKMDLTIAEGADPTERKLELYPISKPGLMTVSVVVDPIAANITVDGKIYPARRIIRIADIDPNKPHKIEITSGGYSAPGADIAAGKLKAEYKFTLKRLKNE